MAELATMPLLPVVVPELSLDLYRHELAGKHCRRVRETDDVRSLIQAMERFCSMHGGASLAAPQVGHSLRLAILMAEPGKPKLLINPEVVNLGGKDLFEPEGCLSLPPHDEATARVWRSEIAHVASGTLENPDARVVTIYKGRLARVAQHEIDHLDGLFFIDRCGPVAKGLVLRRFNRYLLEKQKNSFQPSTFS
jgi:peptide deformylase